MKMKYLKDVVTLRLYVDKCITCGMCMEVCPHEVFAKKGHKIYIDKKDHCIECGACAKNCPVNAIEVRSGVG